MIKKLFILSFSFLILLASFVRQPVFAQGSWTQLGLSGRDVGSLVNETNNASILYAGTDDGVYKSVDAGSNWSPTSNQGTPATVLVISPSDNDILYASKGNNHVQKSVDGGSTWTDITNNLPSFLVLLDLAIDPNNSNIVYAALYGQCGGVWKTTNAGNTWSSVSGGCDFYRIVFAPSDSNTIYAGSLNISNFFLKSTDGGNTWFGPANQGLPGNIGAVRGIAVDPTNPSTVYVGVETAGVYKTTNGGDNWEFLDNSPAIEVALALTTHPTDSNLVYARSSSGGVSESIDGGANWSDLSLGQVPSNIRRLVIFNNNQNHLYSTTTDGVYIIELSPTTSVNAPVIGTFTAPAEPAIVNSNINISANFTDSNTSDTHTAVWDWGDTTTSAGTITESNGSGTVNGTHTYTSAGVYTVSLTVTDNSNLSGNALYQYIVIYDSNAGFITASGKYTSQAGWHITNPSATGEVKFGIQAKYTSNNILSGSTKLNFKTGDLDFNSTSYQWLVVNNEKGYLTGTGTVNGTGNYTIFISVVDGDIISGQDLIRVRITDNSTQNAVYDTQPDISLLADPTTTLDSGSIKVH